MSASHLPVGAFVRIEPQGLQQLIEHLHQAGYRTLAPRVVDDAILYDEVAALDELPRGVLDEQDGGTYRLSKDEAAGYFDYVVGPNSLKNYVFPPRETLLEAHRSEAQWQFHTPAGDAPPTAVIGVRGCDLAALAVQDRVFLEGPYVDPGYRARRESLFLVAVNCRRAAATCFCHSMGTGPMVREACDLALTELDSCIVVQVGSEQGGQMIARGDWSPATVEQIERAQALPRDLAERMRASSTEFAEAAEPPCQRHLDTTGIRDLLLQNLDHARWQQVAERCLACANCTLVCPTCFCSSVEEVNDLTGDHVRRQRLWASCFTSDHSYMNSGTVRKSIAARYRQWLTHKLGSWIDQYGTSGCVGCGRCITWCPVGIDLTEEVRALRER